MWSRGVERLLEEDESARSPARLLTLRWNGVAVNSWIRGERMFSPEPPIGGDFSDSMDSLRLGIGG